MVVCETAVFLSGGGVGLVVCVFGAGADAGRGLLIVFPCSCSGCRCPSIATRLVFRVFFCFFTIFVHDGFVIDPIILKEA